MNKAGDSIMTSIIISVTLISLFLFTTCSTKSVTLSEATPVPAPTSKITETTWKGDWDNLIQKAKKEALVTFYTPMGPDARIPLAEAFKKQYGISVEFIAGRGPSIIPKLLAERKAGIYMADVYMGGSSPIVGVLKPEGVLEPLDTALILPEVTGPKSWFEGKIPFLDSSHTILTLTYAPSKPLWVNTSMVKLEEVKSYMDLLNPRWKGQVMINDPTIDGQGNQWFSVYGGVLLGFDYMQKLANQEPIIMRDLRQQAEWLARGKYAMSIGIGWSSYKPFVDVGAPLQIIDVKEGDYLTGADSNIALINKAAHPNAARLLINWLASKEGSTMLAKYYQRQSARIDVPIEFEGERIVSYRDAALKYYNPEKEEFLIKRKDWVERAREIFGPLLR